MEGKTITIQRNIGGQFVIGHKHTKKVKLKLSRSWGHHSQEAKNKISQANKGKNIGKHFSPKTEFKKGEHRSPSTEFKKGSVPWSKGLKMSEDFRKKLSEVIKKRYSNGGRVWNKGIKYHQITGAKHHNWKGGISKNPQYRSFLEMRRKIRKKKNGGSHILQEWEILKAQYNYTCPSCGRKEPKIKLTEDHIVPLSKGGRDDIKNIQPLCGRCNSVKQARFIKFKILCQV